MADRRIAKVYVEKAVYHMDCAFDYLIPEGMEQLCRGCRVLVPFGRANKKIQGLVSEVITSAETEGPLKTIFSVIDQTPLLTAEQLSIVEFLVENTFCSHYDAVKCILPGGANVSVTESYRLKAEVDEKILEELPPTQRRVAAFLKNNADKSYKTLSEINAFFNTEKNPNKASIIKALIDCGIIEKAEQSRARIPKKTVKMARLADDIELQKIRLTPKQREVTQMLLQLGMAMIKELSYLCGVTEAVIKGLERKGIIVYFNREITQSYGEIIPQFNNLSQVELSAEQGGAFEEIAGMTDDTKPNAALLYGVTGSGKTQVYIKLIEYVLKAGKTAVMLVPEIALTPQLLAKFNTLFGEVIGVIHSNLSAAERLETDKRIRAEQVKIVIGTRSAIFAPLQNIGIIILDEEGEASYKSEAPPRYHARELAKYRCVKHNATLLLASATPSIDSYYRAMEGKYRYFCLEERYADANLPSVYIVDMLEEQKQKNFSSISEILAQQLLMNLKSGEQSILLINRRGYHTFASCMACGELVKCPNCDVSMTFHKTNGYMMCHRCGHSERLAKTCKGCGSEYIKLSGLGTQKLEDELSTLLPSARILRMDTDTTYSKFSFEKDFSDFQAHKYDIMLGTQMIAKGLDFPNVTLVGVLGADSGLYSSDFKASERIFSLITQVVGRSGRSEKKGRAYIQTTEPDNPIINFAANQDYKAFYEDEIFTRREMGLPPFCDLVMLGFAGVDEKNTEAAAKRAMDILKAESDRCMSLAKYKGRLAMKVMGISRATVYRVNNKYRYRILIKCKFNNAMKSVLSQALIACGKDKLFSGVSCFADVNGDIG